MSERWGAAGVTQCSVFGPDKPQCGVGAIVMLTAGVTILVTDILDVVDLPRAVREGNGAAPRVTLRPAGAGLAVNVRF